MEPSSDPSEAPSGRASRGGTRAGGAPRAGSTRSAAKASGTARAGTAKATRTTQSTGGAKAGAAKASPPRKRASPRATDDPAVPTRNGDGGRRSRGPGRRGLYDRGLQRRSEHWPVPTRVLAAVLRHPELVLALLGARAAVERDGRVLNRSTQAMLALAGRFGGSERGGADRPDPVTMRKQLRLSSGVAMPTRTDVHVWGLTVPGEGGAPDIPVRVYRRFGTGLGAEPGPRGLPPAIVYFHGGGWVVGDLGTHDGTCRLLAAVSRCVVVAVDYRLAPEHPFPAAVDDCLAAYRWVHRTGDELGIAPGRVGVMGDSAGGNLAAVVAQRASDGDVPPPVAQGLVYPALDAHLDTESVRSMGDGYFLTRGDMEYFRGEYLPDRSDWDDPRASPLLTDDVTGLAPALVVTAGFDPLRDDGARYAEALRKGGVDVEYRCYQDQIHGFMGMGILSDSLALATEVCDAMGILMRRPAEPDS